MYVCVNCSIPAGVVDGETCVAPGICIRGMCRGVVSALDITVLAVATLLPTGLIVLLLLDFTAAPTVADGAKVGNKKSYTHTINQ